MKKYFWIAALVVGMILLLLSSGKDGSDQDVVSDDVVQSNEDSTSLNTDNTGSEDSTILGQKRYASSPEIFLDVGLSYQVKLITNFGPIVINLFHDEVPVAANNFAFLAKEGFYNDLTFHRVVKDFMIQGGDPVGDGTGDGGYKFNDEPVTREYTRGMVAYANSGPNTNGSQFFIMHADYPLPPSYIIFGQVVDGLETVDKIANVQVQAGQFGEVSVPVEKIIIENATLDTL